MSNFRQIIWQIIRLPHTDSLLLQFSIHCCCQMSGFFQPGYQSKKRAMKRSTVYMTAIFFWIVNDIFIAKNNMCNICEGDERSKIVKKKKATDKNVCQKKKKRQKKESKAFSDCTMGLYIKKHVCLTFRWNHKATCPLFPAY